MIVANIKIIYYNIYIKGATETRFALVISYLSKKQPILGRGGCFFDAYLLYYSKY